MHGAAASLSEGFHGVELAKLCVCVCVYFVR